MNNSNYVLLFFICVICTITTNCGIGNIILHRTGTSGFNEESTLIDDTNAVPTYRVQIGIFDSQADADKLAESARSITDYSVYVVYIPPFYRVRIGDFIRKSDAEEYVDFLRQEGFSDARYVYISYQ